MQIILRSTACRPLILGHALRASSRHRQWYTTRRKNKSGKRRIQQLLPVHAESELTSSESDIEAFSEETHEEFAQLQKELEKVDTEDPAFAEVEPEAAEIPEKQRQFPEFRIPHSFIGFNPRRMDLEDLPRLRTDFDGKRSRLIWMGTECQRCGLQIRRERRSNRETSLNVYASPKIPDDLLRHCPQEKSYPVLWRTRDPYVALDILAVEDY